MDGSQRRSDVQRNVLGDPIASCSHDPVTGFFRDGCCNTGPLDQGLHTVCAVMTDAFLEFSKSAGNDLSTARPDAPSPRGACRAPGSTARAASCLHFHRALA